MAFPPSAPAPGMPELLEGGAGVLVPPADSVALAGALEQVLGSSELRAQLGEAGRRRIEAEFDVATIAGELVCRFAGRAPVSRPALHRLLFVTRNFAPASHVSVERAIKLAKYLPEFGWRPTILTGFPSSAGLPEDPALLDQVGGVDVIRARAPELSLFYSAAAKPKGNSVSQRGNARRGSLHPKAWLVPDSQLLWYPFAVREALRRARAESWEVVLATSHPPTAIVIAHRIASRLGIPYVADFRDSWTKYHAAPRRPAPLAELERRLEARMIRDAAAVVTVDPHIVEHALTRIPVADHPPCHVIQNGYDEDEFRGVVPASLPACSIVHTGQLRRAPVRSGRGCHGLFARDPSCTGECTSGRWGSWIRAR